MLYDTLSINENGHLTIAGQDVLTLAAQYGTPAYILDEETIRRNCRAYTETFKRCMPAGSRPLYASKALCLRALYPILAEEGFGADVVSGGELQTVLSAGFPAERIYFHGNYKSDEEIRLGVQSDIGAFIVDNPQELVRISAAAAQAGKVQRVLLRLTPGIDPHTFAAVNTGKIDCQFGQAMETGQAKEFVAQALSTENLSVEGYHCHIGSQIFGQVPFVDAAKLLIAFTAEMHAEFGYMPRYLNLGGGFGVRYVESDPQIDIPGCIERLSAQLQTLCAQRGMPVPQVFMEPGRSIVADAGITLYTVGTVKDIRGYRKYAVVDGGMSDNPRYALYGAQYTIIAANKAALPAEESISIAGRCCESGALIQEHVLLPHIEPGDTLAVLTTGAYNYSMASNYNDLRKSPVVLLRGGSSRIVSRRQTWEEMKACELL